MENLAVCVGESLYYIWRCSAGAFLSISVNQFHLFHKGLTVVYSFWEVFGVPHRCFSTDSYDFIVPAHAAVFAGSLALIFLF